MTQLSNLIIKATPSSIFVEERIFFKSINLKPITKTKKGKKKTIFLIGDFPQIYRRLDEALDYSCMQGLFG